MSVAPAPIYNPEPFNPTVYEQLNTDSRDYIVNSTLSNCSINDSNLTNCVLIGPIFSGSIKTKTLTLFNDNSLDTVSFTTEGNINNNNNVDIKFLPNAGSTANTALTIKNVENVSHSFNLAGNALHNGNLSVGGNIELTGNNKSIQLNTSGSIYCEGAAVSVTEQEIAYLSGVTSNLQTQLNNKITSNSNATLNSLNTTTTSYFATSSGNVGIGRDSSSYKLDVSTNARIGNFVIETNANNFNYNGFSPNSGLKIFWNSIGSINNNNGRTSFLNCGQGGTGGYDFYSCWVNGQTPDWAQCRMGSLVLNGNLSVTDPAATITTTNNITTTNGDIIISGENKTLQLSSTGGIYCGGAVVTVSQQEIAYLSGVTSNIQTQLNNKITSNSNATLNTLLIADDEAAYVSVQNTSTTTPGIIRLISTEAGNFIQSGTTAIDGTPSDRPLIFNTWWSNEARFYFDMASHSLGIGKTPTVELDVNGACTTTNNITTTSGDIIIAGENKTLQLSSTGGIYCGGAAVTVNQQEIAYVSGVTSNLQTQLNNKITSNSDATLNSLNTTTTSYFATSSGNVGIGRSSSFYKLDVSTNARIGNFVIETDANKFNYSGFSPNSGLKIFWNAIGSIGNNNGRTSFLNCGQGGSGGFDFYSCFVNQQTPNWAQCRMGPLVLNGNLSVTDPAATITPTELSYLSGVTSNIQTQINNINTGTAGNPVSFTPVLTSSGGGTGTYFFQKGTYSINNKICTFNALIQLDSKSGYTNGNLSVNLPVAVSADAEASICVSRVTSTVTTQDFFDFTLNTSTSSSSASIQYKSSASNNFYSNLDTNRILDSFTIRYGGSYITV